MSFDREAYEREVASLRAQRFPDLLFGDMLFGLAERMKLSVSPPVELTSEEITGGLESAFYTHSSDATLLDRLRLVLPHVTAARRGEGDPFRAQLLMGTVTACANRLSGELSAHDIDAFASVVKKWLEEAERYLVDDAHALLGSQEELRSGAENPAVAGIAHAVVMLRARGRTVSL